MQFGSILAPSPRWDQRQRHRDQLRAVRRVKMEQFADLIADDYTQTAASRLIGMSQQCGNSYFQQMRDELGYQAIDIGAPIRSEFRGRADLACAALARGESITQDPPTLIARPPFAPGYESDGHGGVRVAS